MFDAITAKLHQLLAFRQMPISQLDLMLADLRRQFVHDMDEHRWRLVVAFKTEIDFYELDGAAA